MCHGPRQDAPLSSSITPKHQTRPDGRPSYNEDIDDAWKRHIFSSSSRGTFFRKRQSALRDVKYVIASELILLWHLQLQKYTTEAQILKKREEIGVRCWSVCMCVGFSEDGIFYSNIKACLLNVASMASTQCISNRQALAKTLNFNCPRSVSMERYVGILNLLHFAIISVYVCGSISTPQRWNSSNCVKDTLYALNLIQGMSSTVNQWDLTTIYLSTPYHLPPSPSFPGCTLSHEWREDSQWEKHS